MEKQKINARIVADSINPQGNRITTFVLTYPRIIHAEVMTHRLFSRNTASSRAIPFKTMVKSIENDPFIPIAWQKDHKGMQGVEYLSSDESERAKKQWLRACDNACISAKMMNNNHFGVQKPLVTKQLCNRLLEPFQWHTALVTVTELENFYELRCPKYTIYSENMPMYFKSRKDLNKYVESVGDEPFKLTEEEWWMLSESGAEIHIQALAEAMWDAQNESKPKQLKAGEWHIPFGDRISVDSLIEFNPDIRSVATREELENQEIQNKWLWHDKIKIATARAARLSYMTFDGEIDYEKDIALYDSLLASKHMSPFEHCARVMSNEEYNSFFKGQFLHTYTDENNFGWCNNFKGFIQHRYMIENNYK